MNTQDIILLFSKYSKQCVKLLKKTKSISEIRPIPVDNKAIRKRVLKDSQLNINIVPCILVVNATGIIEKYEGMKAFEWIEEYLDYKDQDSNTQSNVSFIEPFQPPPQQQPPQQPPQQPQPVQQQQPPQQQQPVQQQQPPQQQQPVQQQQQQISQPLSEIPVPPSLSNQSSKVLMQNRFTQQHKQDKNAKAGRTAVSNLRFETEGPPPQAIRSKQSIMEAAENLKRGREDSFKNNSK